MRQLLMPPVPQFISLVVTLSTNLMTFAIHFFVLVSVGAASFTTIYNRASKHVCSVRNRFNMSGTKTSDSPTDVIKLKTVRNWSYNYLICNSVNSLFYSLDVNSTIPITSFTAIPNHAWVVSPILRRVINEFFQPFYQILGTVKLVSHLSALLWRVCQPHTVSSGAGLFYCTPSLKRYNA